MLGQHGRNVNAAGSGFGISGKNTLQTRAKCTGAASLRKCGTEQAADM